MGWEVTATPPPLYIREREPVSNLLVAGWTPVSVWTGTKILPPLVFDPWTVQPQASGYADWAIPAHIAFSVWVNNDYSCIILTLLGFEVLTGTNLFVLLKEILTFDKDIEKEADDKSPSHSVCTVPTVWAVISIWVSGIYELLLG